MTNEEEMRHLNGNCLDRAAMALYGDKAHTELFRVYNLLFTAESQRYQDGFNMGLEAKATDMRALEMERDALVAKVARLEQRNTNNALQQAALKHAHVQAHPPVWWNSPGAAVGRLGTDQVDEALAHG